MTSRNRLTTIDHQPHHNHGPEEEDDEIPGMLPAIIFDASYCGEPVPAGFDAVRIVIDGKIKGDLSWKEERDAALAYTARGLRLFWEIDLALPAGLEHPLSNRMQFLSLSLSLEHFCNTLWKEFRKETIGLSLYRGTPDFSKEYIWDEEQTLNLQEWLKDLYPDIEAFVSETGKAIPDFAALTDQMMQREAGAVLLKCFCRDAVGEYLNLLASRVPDNLPLFLVFDTTEIGDPFVTAQLLTKERYPRFHIAVKSHKEENRRPQILGGEIAWEGPIREKGLIARTIGRNPINEKPKLGLCLPKMSTCRPGLVVNLSNVLKQLLNRGTPFRVIPETELAVEWDGLDDLIVESQVVELQFKRKLQGFCAAGGRVVCIGQPIGLAHEIPLGVLHAKPI